ncbi:MAG: BlaI/MecI/CopY family transcriptional regulator [Acidobacteria bacterium]|nr:BlaI/MecI/CopY family transcriptional regulator [Acidobacteriota bacterium]
MAARSQAALTPLELEIMNVLWTCGECNVQTVQQALPRELAYTTVQTVLNILERKGRVKRAKRDRAFYYRPAVSRSQVAQNALHDLVERLFGGSAENLVMSLLEARRLTPQKLERLRQAVADAQQESARKKGARRS